jgi:hypothetical protein
VYKCPAELKLILVGSRAIKGREADKAKLFRKIGCSASSGYAENEVDH